MNELEEGPKPVAMIYGTSTLTEFYAAIKEKDLKVREYVYAHHPSVGKVLAQLEELEFKSNLNFERARIALEGEKIPVNWRRSGRFRLLGYRGPRGDLILPPTPLPPGTELYRA
ncbi:MAG: hypothetical protein J7L88_01180, partial [Thermoplasmata archaeon]|nr:hypothetical protein [Thermoplasmata archaeon]